MWVPKVLADRLSGPVQARTFQETRGKNDGNPEIKSLKTTLEQLGGFICSYPPNCPNVLFDDLRLFRMSRISAKTTRKI